MTINIGLAEPAPISGGTRQEARGARRRQHVVTLVMLATVVRAARDRRTLAGAIMVAIVLVAAKRLATQGGTPGLDWYLARGRDESRNPA